MLDIFVTAINAILPIVLLILLGYVLKRAGFFNQPFLKAGNKLVFNVCLPCMLFINIYDGMKNFYSIRWDVVLYTVAIIAVIFVLGLVTSLLATKDNNKRGVILQCTFRSNYAIIGLSLVERLGGDGAMASIVSAFCIPLFNILAVIALTVFVNKEEAAKDADGNPLPPASKRRAFLGNVKKILKGIVTNPLIIGVFVGLLFVAARAIESAACGFISEENLPFRFDNQLKFLYDGVSYLKNIAQPLALIVLGGQFEFSAVKGMTKEIITGTVWRIIIAPLIGIGFAVLLSSFTPVLDFGPDVYPTLIALFGTPVAVSSAIMAGSMHNDEQLATQYVVWSSLCSVITIFLTVLILMSAGLVSV